MTDSLPTLAHGLLDYSALRPEQLEPLFRTLRDTNIAALEQIIQAHGQSPGWDNFVLAIDRLDQRIEGLFDLLVPLAYEDGAWRDAVNACYELCMAWKQDKYSQPGLHDAYQRLDTLQLDDERKVVHALILRDLRLGGHGLHGTELVQLRETEAAIARLQDQFLGNLEKARTAWDYLITDESDLAGLPSTLRERLAANAQALGKQGWRLDLEQATVEALLAWADDRKLRETVYRASRNLASDLGPDSALDNEPVLRALLRLRHERAQLLGLTDAAQLGLETREARTAEQVEGFIENLIEQNRPRLQDDLRVIEAHGEQLGIAPVEPWDTAYLARQLRLQGSEEIEMRMQTLFPLDRVLTGLWQLHERLLGIRISSSAVVAWHPDVHVLEVSEAGATLGHIYLDIYARADKLPWPTCYPMRQRHVDADGVVILPAVLLSCYVKRVAGQPASLLSHEQLCQLFHEFGHALNQVLVTNRHRRLNRVADTSLGADRCEFVGKFMEQWCWSASTLHAVAQPASVSLPQLRQWLAARSRMQSVSEAEQLRKGWFDFFVHRDPDARQNLRQLAVAATRRVGLPEGFAEDRFAETFDYMVTGYEAGFYTYKWAQTHAIDAFTRFEAADADEAALGRALRHEILAKGGLRGMGASFLAFVGRNMSLQAYARRQGSA